MTPSPDTPEVLVERLRRLSDNGAPCCSDGSICYEFPGTDLYDDCRATIERLTAENKALREAVGRAIETLAAGSHLLGKYTPEHRWMEEHNKRIGELKALQAADATARTALQDNG